MSEELKKKYRVLKAVAISGIVNPGEFVELTEAEATNIGIGEYLEEVVEGQDTGSDNVDEKSHEATGDKGNYANDDEDSDGEKKPDEENGGDAGAGEGTDQAGQ